MSHKKIFLVGYMGSGKTSVGRILAHKLNLPMYDTDQLIELKSGKTVAAIFEEEGEKTFRAYEGGLIREIRSESKNGIYATGGGLPCFYNHMDIINEAGISFYLKLSPQRIAKRIEHDVKRPIIKNKSSDELISFIKKHLQERRRYYEKAHLHVLAYNKPEKVADRIIRLITKG